MYRTPLVLSLKLVALKAIVNTCGNRDGMKGNNDHENTIR